MGGGGTNTAGSGGTNFDKTAFSNQLGAGIQSAYNQGYAVNPENQYGGLSTQTQTGLNNLYNASTANATGLNAANAANTATIQGGAGAVNPYFEANLQKTLADQAANVNAAYSANGRYGSNIASEGLASAVGNTSNQARQQQYQYQQGRVDNAINNAGQLYQNTLQPYQTQIGVGGAYDASNQAAINARNAAFRERNDAAFTNAQRVSALLQGQPQQEKQSNGFLDALGAAGSLASIFL